MRLPSLRKALLLVPALALGGCAHSSLLLVPDDQGHLGAVALLDPQDGHDVALVNQTSRTNIGGGSRGREAVDPDRLPARERELLAYLPPKPMSYTLYFYENSTQVVPESLPVLEQAKRDSMSRPGVEVQITGHTDRVGDDDFNDRLSLARASEILESFVRDRIFRRDELSVVGRGERQPLIPTADGVEEPRNRRVEIIVR